MRCPGKIFDRADFYVPRNDFTQSALQEVMKLLILKMEPL